MTANVYSVNITEFGVCSSDPIDIISYEHRLSSSGYVSRS